jgi:hypothetical protein
MHVHAVLCVEAHAWPDCACSSKASGLGGSADFVSYFWILLESDSEGLPVAATCEGTAAGESTGVAASAGLSWHNMARRNCSGSLLTEFIFVSPSSTLLLAAVTAAAGPQAALDGCSIAAVLAA